ncbi:MAG: hypothetical protein QOK42_1893, partial [Frankiaceae bacterium]|nr:hypothetical protein [Frankiaceae bacterium]
ASPRWLSAEEQQAWRAYLGMSVRLFDLLDRELQRDSGMPHGYYEILVRLSEAPERALRMSDLADRSLSSRSRISHAVARLEERGWVQRRPCAGDARGLLAVLTDEGFAALADAAPGHVEAVRENFMDLLTPAQVKALRGIGETVLGHLGGEEALLNRP